MNVIDCSHYYLITSLNFFKSLIYCSDGLTRQRMDVEDEAHSKKSPRLRAHPVPKASRIY